MESDHVCCGCHDREVFREGLLQAVKIAEDHWARYKDNKAYCLLHVINEIKKVAEQPPAAQARTEE